MSLPFGPSNQTIHSLLELSWSGQLISSLTLASTSLGSTDLNFCRRFTAFNQCISSLSVLLHIILGRLVLGCLAPESVCHESPGWWWRIIKMLSLLAGVCLWGAWGWGSGAAGAPTACLYRDSSRLGQPPLCPHRPAPSWREEKSCSHPYLVSLPSDYGNEGLSVLWSDGLSWWNIHNIKLTILAIFKCTVRWFYIHSIVYSQCFPCSEHFHHPKQKLRTH